MKSLEALRDQPHISVSSLSLWLRCPRKFWFRYFQKAEASHRSIGLVFGHAWHSVIGFLLMAHQRGLDSRATELRDYFAVALEQEIESDGPPVLFEDDENFDTLVVTAGRMLDAFLERVPLPERVLHVELPFRSSCSTLTRAKRSRCR